MEKSSTCSLSKLTRKTINKARNGSNRSCEIIHTDLIGLITPATFVNKNKYILTFLDNYTCFLQTFVLKSKIQVPECLEQSLRTLKSMFSEKYSFKLIRCHNGIEFTGNVTTLILDKYNIELQTAEPYTQNIMVQLKD